MNRIPNVESEIERVGGKANDNENIMNEKIPFHLKLIHSTPFLH